ncbi:MAG: DUF3618 domain-containing protein [Brevibacterium yomogidense]|uniref:DUF3618 domain-containing protein n=1 Tax=Brevibacterium yomogidense TaxID=946573 RepID=A0A1X6XIJ4_9MICO|nr:MULTISPECIES: DUF3618 domain-containing protein [Brevibacterium]SLM98960.1 hypothetical protein FM105_09985 [Brevibacterium yomogidense]SMX76153.1 Protein of unknown function (DUF3618) [Brevibacterium sp. Mu109]
MSSNVYTSEVTVDNASRDQLSESIRLREQRLAAGIDELVGRLHPKALTARAADSAKSVVIDEEGQPKVDRLALAGGVLLVTVATIGFFATRSKRG